MTRRIIVSALLLGALFCPVPAWGQGAAGAATQIEKALKTGNPQASQVALAVWESSKEDILADFTASIRVGMAFSRFGALPIVRRYQSLPETCADAARECAEAAEGSTGGGDPSAVTRVAQVYMGAALVYIAAGVGDKGDDLLGKARELFESAVAAEQPPVSALMGLGRLYGKLAERDPGRAEELLGKAGEALGRVRETSGDSSELCLRSGELDVQLAELKRLRLEKEPKNRKLAKEITKLYEAAMKRFAQGLKLSKSAPGLKTTYNETLWIYKKLNGGKAKWKPILKEYQTKYHKLSLKLPESSLWRVVPRAEAKDKDEMFHAFKLNRKEGQALSLFVDQYKWDTNYINPETNETIGGDNIGGLARRSERELRAYFTDIKDRKPLGKVFFSKRIPKARGYIVKGKTEKGDLLEWRAIFFKHSKAQRTFRVLVIADLGMLDRNPYELKEVLSSFDFVKKR